jgi:hypothetical protein
VLFSLAGCTGLKVSSEADPSYAFSRIKTYQWIDAPAEVLEQEDNYLNVELQKCLNNELAARGWKQVLDAEEASIQVAYFVKLKAHQERAGREPDTDRLYAGGLVYERGSGAVQYRQEWPDEIVYTVETGTLHLQLSEVLNGREIWNGTIETVLNRSNREEERDKLYRRIARELVKQIP